MGTLRTGIVLRRPDPRAFVAAVREAEQASVSAAWTTQGGVAPDALAMLAVAATQTERIELGTAVVPTYPRHPTALVSQALVVSNLSSGRFRLGIGPSHRPTMEGMFGLTMTRPLEHLREYLTIARALLWEGSADFAGAHFKVEARLPPGVVPPRTPLLISALRAGAFRLAGELADGAISWMCPVPYLVGTAKPALQEGAQAAGRAAPPLIGHVPVALHGDRAQTHAAARQHLASYGRLPFYAGMFRDAGYPVGADGSLPDALLDELVVSGTDETVAARLHEIQAAGVDELIITPVPVADAIAEERALVQLLSRV
jgi:F420-dependent oxidoreductase-like protein